MSERRVRAEKEAMVGAIREKLDGSAFVLLADPTGLTVEDLSALRAALRARNGRLTVVKNTFFAKAAEALGYGNVTELLHGPSAMVTGSGDAAEAARTVRDFAKQTGRPSLRGGVMDSVLLSADDVAAIADLPPRPILLGIVLGTLAAPMTRLAGVLHQKVASVLYVLKAVQDKKSGTANE
jgi:large subunit ribosomal protein L10